MAIFSNPFFATYSVYARNASIETRKRLLFVTALKFYTVIAFDVYAMVTGGKV